MARAGEVLENPVGGQRIAFLAPAGRLLGYRASYPEYEV
jgi:hypothetical protein